MSAKLNIVYEIFVLIVLFCLFFNFSHKFWSVDFSSVELLDNRFFDFFYAAHIILNKFKRFGKR